MTRHQHVSHNRRLLAVNDVAKGGEGQNEEAFAQGS